ncbi:MAG: hypothetical protein MUF54_05550, partial [Polyangiaceae bacterium]|nr:hypothetical protein [Polyangiaceae bacterium]
MDIKMLEAVPPWDWPQDAAELILATITDRVAAPSVRLLAATLAGECTVVRDDMAAALLSVAADVGEPEQLRCLAAISLGPAFEYYHTMPDDNVGMSAQAYARAQERLQSLFLQESVPTRVRRSVLEASIRGPQTWHAEAIRDAYEAGGEWRHTAVFCMRFIHGFDQLIVEALLSDDPQTKLQAVHAAGAWELQEAWPEVRRLMTGRRPDKPLLLAAIESAGSIPAHDARALLSRFAEDADEDVAS